MKRSEKLCRIVAFKMTQQMNAALARWCAHRMSQNGKMMNMSEGIRLILKAELEKDLPHV